MLENKKIIELEDVLPRSYDSVITISGRVDSSCRRRCIHGPCERCRGWILISDSVLSPYFQSILTVFRQTWECEGAGTGDKGQTIYITLKVIYTYTAGISTRESKCHGSGFGSTTISYGAFITICSRVN